MIRDFKSILLPPTLEYRSDNDHIPLEFYISIFPISKEIDMHLGYFCSNAIMVLNAVFAQFIYYGGNLRLIINNVLNFEDKENLINNTEIRDEDQVKKIIANLILLKNELNGGKHFFDCLRHLIKINRLKILPV